MNNLPELDFKFREVNFNNKASFQQAVIRQIQLDIIADKAAKLQSDRKH